MCVASTSGFVSSLSSSFLSDHPCFPWARQLPFPPCGGQISCALPPMRTLAPLPSAIFSQVINPTNTTSWRFVSTTSRNPPASKGPRITSTTMTSPWARRSLTHAEDEPITLKKKVVILVRCQPVMKPVVKLFCQFQLIEKFRATAQKVSKPGRFSLTVKQRFEEHEFQADYDRRTKQKIEWNDWVAERRKFVVLIKETNNSDKIINFCMNSNWSKTGIHVTLMRKASVISGVLHSTQ